MDDSHSTEGINMKIEELEKMLSEGKLDRREFIKRATVLGLAAPFATALFAQSAQAAMPKKGVNL